MTSPETRRRRDVPEYVNETAFTLDVEPRTDSKLGESFICRRTTLSTYIITQKIPFSRLLFW